MDQIKQDLLHQSLPLEYWHNMAHLVDEYINLYRIPILFKAGGKKEENKISHNQDATVCHLPTHGRKKEIHSHFPMNE